jgi:hypothetical protein
MDVHVANRNQADPAIDRQPIPQFSFQFVKGV